MLPLPYPRARAQSPGQCGWDGGPRPLQPPSSARLAQEAPLHAELHPHAPLHVLHPEGRLCLHQRLDPLRQRGVEPLHHGLGENPAQAHLTLPLPLHLLTLDPSSPTFSPFPFSSFLFSLSPRMANPPSAAIRSSLNPTPLPAAGDGAQLPRELTDLPVPMTNASPGWEMRHFMARVHNPPVPPLLLTSQVTFRNSLPQFPHLARTSKLPSYTPPPTTTTWSQSKHTALLFPSSPAISPVLGLPQEGKLREYLKNSLPITKGSISK